MRLLTYQDLDTRRVNVAFAKLQAAVEADDFGLAKRLGADMALGRT
jgi:hypothetical protein